MNSPHPMFSPPWTVYVLDCKFWVVFNNGFNAHWVLRTVSKKIQLAFTTVFSKRNGFLGRKVSLFESEHLSSFK